MSLLPLGFGLMCKPPRPGTSKTRLAATVGMDTAAALSRAFLEDCARTVRDAAAQCRLDPVACFRPADAEAELAGILGPRWPLAFADAGDLGATMRDVLGQLLGRCPAGALIMGADVPLIDSATICAAARALRDGDARRIVLNPTADGGYCLLGVRSIEAAAALCAPMAWSTPGVLAETLRRAEAAGLSVHLLPVQRDIDEAADLDWLREQLERSPGRAAATRAVLGALPAAGR
jgi:rSAM/selenodomain-associated transferase 1